MTEKKRRGPAPGTRGPNDKSKRKKPGAHLVAEFIVATLREQHVECPPGYDWNIDQTEGDKLDWIELFMKLEDKFSIPVEMENDPQLCKLSVMNLAEWVSANAWTCIKK